MQQRPSAPRRPYSTSHQWISRNLLAVTVLGLFIGLIGISLGLLKRVAPGATEKAVTQVAQHSTMLQRLSLLDRRLFSQGHQGIQHSTMLQRLSLLLVMTVMGVCFLAGRTMEERADEFIHYAQIERYVAGNYSTDSGGAMLGGFHASAMIFARLIEGSTKEDIRLFVLLISGATILLFSSLVRAFQPQARALLHESSLARTMPTDRILTGRCDTTLVDRGRSSDSRSHSRGRPHSPARLGSGREGHRR